MIAEAVSLSAVSPADVAAAPWVIVLYKAGLIAIAGYFIMTLSSTWQRVALSIATVMCLFAGLADACPKDMTPLIDCSRGKCVPVCVPSYDRVGLVPVQSPVDLLG